MERAVATQSREHKLAYIASVDRFQVHKRHRMLHVLISVVPK